MKKRKIIGGCDIGSLGALVLNNGKHPDGSLSYRMLKPKEYSKWFREALRTHPEIEFLVYVEKLHAFPGMSSKAVWGMAQNQGILMGIFESLEIPYKFISAQSWQKDLDMPKGESYQQRKINLFMKAKELFPEEPVFKYNGDAYLICRYGLNQEKEKENG